MISSCFPRWPLLALALPYGACFSVDPALLEEKDASREPDTGSSETSPDAGEGETSPDAGGSETSPDASESDASVSFTPCETDQQCSTEQFCSLHTRQCEARCDEQRGCAQPKWPIESTFALSLMADGQTLYWGSPNTTDGAGNPRNDAKIWTWDMLSEPRQLSVGVCVYPALVVDGFMYCHVDPGSRGLARFRVDGTGESQLLSTGEVYVWSTADYVWWSSSSTTVGAVARQISRIARAPGAEPEVLPPREPNGVIIAGNATSYFHIHPQDIPDHNLLIESIATPTTRVAVPNAECYLYNPTAIDAEAIYCSLWTGLKRVPTNGVGDAKFLYHDQVFQWIGRAQLRGDFAYWVSGNVDSSKVNFGRTHKRLESGPELLLSLPWHVDPSQVTAGKSTEFAWVNDNLVYLDDAEQRLFVRSFPDLR